MYVKDFIGKISLTKEFLFQGFWIWKHYEDFSHITAYYFPGSTINAQFCLFVNSCVMEFKNLKVY